MMNIYLNPGDSLFRESINSEIYVDKSMLIAETNKFLNTKRKFACVSRARRFGKTVAMEMLAAYYSKGADGSVFSGLKITEDGGEFEKHLGKFNCLLLDMNSFYNNAADKEKMFGEMSDTVRKEFAGQFPSLAFDAGMNIAKCMREVYDNTGEQFVILIDEYDVLAREECRKWYDGYRLGGYEIYAPLSAVASATDGKFQSYWNGTSSFEALQDYIDADYDGMADDVNVGQTVRLYVCLRLFTAFRWPMARKSSL